MLLPALLAALALLLGSLGAGCRREAAGRAVALAWSADGSLGGLRVRTRTPLPAPEGAARTVTLVATSDLKGWITTGTLYPERPGTGLAHLAPLLRDLRAARPGLILLDGGDALRGAPSTTLRAEGGSAPVFRFPILRLMNALGYDAMALGNGDLALGRASLAHAQARADFALLSANLERVGGGTALPPYTVVEREGVRVAVLGLTTPGAALGLPPREMAGLRLVSLRVAARRWVPILREVEQADLVIALAHSGLDGDYDRETALREGIGLIAGAGVLADDPLGFDLVISGDAHRLSPRTPAGGDSPYAVPVLEPGARGNALAVAEFSLEGRGGRWRVRGISRHVRPALPAPDPAALAIVADDLRVVRERLAEPTAMRFRRVPFRTEFYRCAGALSHGAAAWLAGGRAGAPLSLLPMRWRFAPPARTELGAPLRRAHLHRWILYGDRLVQSELTGRQIELLLEGYVRHLRGWKVRDTQVLWPGGLAVTLPEKGSLMESLNLAADGAPLERHRAYPVWLTVWHRYGGAGLAAQALLRPGPEWGRSDATLRAGLFAWLSDPALALPPQCARWLEH